MVEPSYTGHIQIHPKQYTETEWLEALTLALKCDFDVTFKRQVVEELLRMRRQANMVTFVAAPGFKIDE